MPLAPALAIILSVATAIYIARRQQAGLARANAINIAKNHYKDWLAICIKNSDVVFYGAKQESYEKLVSDPELFRRYRWVFTSMMFALQEVYQTFSKPENYSEAWLNMVRVNSALCKFHVLSEQGLNGPTQAVYDPSFVKFVRESVAQVEHVSAKSTVAVFSDKSFIAKVG
jgi:hypothetical protein